MRVRRLVYGGVLGGWYMFALRHEFLIFLGFKFVLVGFLAKYLFSICIHMLHVKGIR